MHMLSRRARHVAMKAISAAHSEASPLALLPRLPSASAGWPARMHARLRSCQGSQNRLNCTDSTGRTTHADSTYHDTRTLTSHPCRLQVRLVESLNQVWQEERERRAALGLPEQASADATPESAARSRSTLPPPPRKVAQTLHAIDGLLARPPPPPPTTTTTTTIMAPRPFDLSHAVPDVALGSHVDLDGLSGTLSQLVEADRLMGARRSPSKPVEAGRLMGGGTLPQAEAERRAAGLQAQPEACSSQRSIAESSADSCAALLNDLATNEGAELSDLAADEGAELAELSDEVAYVGGEMLASQSQRDASQRSQLSVAELDEEVYKSGGASQAYGIDPNPNRADDGMRPGIDAAWPAADDDAHGGLGGGTGGFSGGDFGEAADDTFEAAYGESAADVETLELLVPSVARLGSAVERRREAERIEIAARGVRGVLSVSVSEASGVVNVEASALPWLQTHRGAASSGWLDELQYEVLSAISSVKHAAIAPRPLRLEEEIAASQAEMRAISSAEVVPLAPLEEEALISNAEIAALHAERHSELLESTSLGPLAVAESLPATAAEPQISLREIDEVDGPAPRWGTLPSVAQVAAAAQTAYAEAVEIFASQEELRDDGDDGDDEWLADGLSDDDVAEYRGAVAEVQAAGAAIDDECGCSTDGAQQAWQVRLAHCNACVAACSAATYDAGAPAAEAAMEATAVADARVLDGRASASVPVVGLADIAGGQIGESEWDDGDGPATAPGWQFTDVNDDDDLPCGSNGDYAPTVCGGSDAGGNTPTLQASTEPAVLVLSDGADSEWGEDGNGMATAVALEPTPTLLGVEHSGNSTVSNGGDAGGDGSLTDVSEWDGNGGAAIVPDCHDGDDESLCDSNGDYAPTVANESDESEGNDCIPTQCGSAVPVALGVGDDAEYPWDEDGDGPATSMAIVPTPKLPVAARLSAAFSPAGGEPPPKRVRHVAFMDVEDEAGYQLAGKGSSSSPGRHETACSSVGGTFKPEPRGSYADSDERPVASSLSPIRHGRRNLTGGDVRTDVSGDEVLPAQPRPLSPKYEFPDLLERLAEVRSKAGGASLPAPSAGWHDSDDEADDIRPPSLPRASASTHPRAHSDGASAASSASQRNGSDAPRRHWSDVAPLAPGTRVLRMVRPPPSASHVASSLDPPVVYSRPFYSNIADGGGRSKMHNRVWHFEGSDVHRCSAHACAHEPAYALPQSMSVPDAGACAPAHTRSQRLRVLLHGHASR